MKIRIGKELRISWSILTQGQNQPLEGRNLRLYLQEPNRQRRTLAFTYDANTLLTVLPASSLTRLGNYALILTENEGQEGQTAVDANPAFTLVETTEEEDTPTTESPNLEVAHINLATGNLTLRMVLQELFSGKEGGDMKTGDILPVLRDGELHRVSAAAVGGTKKKIYKGIFHKAVPAYPKDGYAYIYRGKSAFSPAFKMDDPKNLHKYVEFFKEQYFLNFNYLNIFTNVEGGGPVAILFRTYDSTIQNAEQNLIRHYEEHGRTPIYFIILTGYYRLNQDVAIYINNTTKESLPIYECSVEIGRIGEDFTNYAIEMQSPRFTLQISRVLCTEIPTIKEYTTPMGVITIKAANRTNIYSRRSRKHGNKLINQFDNYGDILVIKKHFLKRNPIRLNCGETKSFKRIKINHLGNKIRKIYRGSGIHTVETTIRQIHNLMGGG